LRRIGRFRDRITVTNRDAADLLKRDILRIEQPFVCEVQRYASQQATPMWRGAEIRAEWSQQNLAAVERLARRVLDLPDDDPRFAAVAEAYVGREWLFRAPYPWNPDLDGWLATLGSSAAGELNDPDDFVSRWAAVTLDQAGAGAILSASAGLASL
jgi:hypothetical protein